MCRSECSRCATGLIQSGFEAGSPRRARSSMIFRLPAPFNGTLAVSTAPAPVTRSRGLGGFVVFCPDDTGREPLIDVAGPVPHEAGRQTEKWRPVAAETPGFEGACGWEP